MNTECKIITDGTIFRFYVTEKGYDDGGYFWTNAVIEVDNWCFNYKTSDSFLEFSELRFMRDKISDLLMDKFVTVETLEFIEPELQIILNPKIDLRDTGKYSYIIEGYEIEDISAEFLLYPIFDGVFTDQHYVLPLYREDLEMLVKYLNEVLDKLK